MKVLLYACAVASLFAGSQVLATETTDGGSHGDAYGSEPHGGQCPYGPPSERPISKPEVNS